MQCVCVCVCARAHIQSTDSLEYVLNDWTYNLQLINFITVSLYCVNIEIERWSLLAVCSTACQYFYQKHARTHTHTCRECVVIFVLFVLLLTAADSSQYS